MVKSDYREAVPKHHGTVTSSGTNQNKLMTVASPRDGGAHESSTMLENNIEEHLGSIFVGTFSKSILTESCGPKQSL